MITNDIYTDEDARFLRSAGVLAGGADRRRRDRRLPAHRDPRRRHRQPDGRRGPRAAVRARWTSSWSSPAATTSRRPSPPRSSTSRSSCSTSPAAGTWPARAAPASSGRTCSSSTRPTWRRTSAWTSTGWSHDAEHARAGRPVLALSRTDAHSVAPWPPGSGTGWTHFRAGDARPRRPRTDGSACSPAPALRSGPATSASFSLGPGRVALVPDQAVLLAGDHVTVAVRVAAGCSLEVVEPGGTVAYAMRGGSARWDVTVEVEDGGGLIWHGEPFVVSEGAAVARTIDVSLGACSTLSLRETLVLGRTAEGPGTSSPGPTSVRTGSPSSSRRSTQPSASAAAASWTSSSTSERWCARTRRWSSSPGRTCTAGSGDASHLSPVARRVAPPRRGAAP